MLKPQRNENQRNQNHPTANNTNKNNGYKGKNRKCRNNNVHDRKRIRDHRKIRRRHNNTPLPKKNFKQQTANTRNQKTNHHKAENK